MSNDPYEPAPTAWVAPPGRWALPIALAVAALFIELVVSTVQLVDEHHRLTSLHDTQSAQVQQAMKFREQLQSLGAETARLADGGDAAAKKIVDAMKQQGVTLTTGEK
jgi:hypothetical protein